MDIKSLGSLLWTNYLWPCIYAVGAAVITVVEQQLQTGQPFSGQAIELAAGAALATFIASRLNPVAGKGEPIVEPHA